MLSHLLITTLLIIRELAELHRANAAKDSRITEATSSIENQFKEEIQSVLEKERIVSNKRQESLKWELQNVRADITRLEQQHSLREEMLRKEIADLQQVNTFLLRIL